MQHILERFGRYSRVEHSGQKTKAPWPTRPRNKKTRLFIDNEFYNNGYSAAFSPSVTVVYTILAKYANATSQTCYPSIARIMREGGLKSRRTVKSAIKELEKYRIIWVSRSIGGSANHYTMISSYSWLIIPSAKKAEEQGQKILVTSAINDPLTHIN